MQNSELLWNPLSGITDALSDLFDGLINRMLSVFITPLSFLLYSLQMGFFYVLDCVQGIFRSMAGLDTYYIDGEKQSGDIVMSMLMNQTIINIFIAVLVVSIMLLFVTTFVAIIRVEFTEKGAGNAKGPIIGRAIKSIAYFAVVPITCLFGIWIANVFLRSFDRATSGDSYSLSTTVFYAAAQNANRARLSEKIATKMMENTELLRALGLNESIVGQEGAQETFARAVDSAFLSRQKVSTYLSTDSMTIDAGAQDYFFAAMLMNLGPDVTFSVFDTTNIYLTFYFYELLMGFNYLIGYVGGFMAASLMLSSAIGLIQRIYELAILFVLSPAAVAFMPLDDGGKYKQWRGEFIKRVGMMYGPVIGLNLMFQVLAVLQHVTIFPDTASNAIFNGLIQLIFMIVGLLSIKEFSQIVSGLVGSSDAMQVGEGKRQDTIKMAQRMGQGTIAAVQTGKELNKATKKTAQYGANKAAASVGRFVGADAWADAREKRVNELKAKGGGLVDTFGKVMRGDKTDLGKSFGNFAAAAGPVAAYFTAGAIAKRKEEGRGGILGSARMFGKDKNDKRSLKERLSTKDDGTLIDDSELHEMTKTVDGQRFRNAGRHAWNAVKHADNARKRAKAAYGSYETADEMIDNNKKIKEEEKVRKEQGWRNDVDTKQVKKDIVSSNAGLETAYKDAQKKAATGDKADLEKLDNALDEFIKHLATYDGSRAFNPAEWNISAEGGEFKFDKVSDKGDSGDPKDVKVEGGEIEAKLADGTTVKVSAESFATLASGLTDVVNAIAKTTHSLGDVVSEIKGIASEIQGIYTAKPKE